MKRFIFISSFILFSVSGFAQVKLAYGHNKADYEHMLGRFMKFYNNAQADSIYGILSSRWSEDQKKNNWNADVTTKIKENIGAMVSYKYIGPFNGAIDIDSIPMVYFKVTFSKAASSHVTSINNRKEHALSMSLDKDGKILAFNFIASSPQVDSLISKY